MPEFAGLSNAVPTTGQLARGALTLFVARIENVSPGVFVNVKLAAGEPPPVKCTEPGLMFSGVLTVGTIADGAALKLTLSIATSCAVPSVVDTSPAPPRCDDGRQNGRENHYSLEALRFAEIQPWLESFAPIWDQSLANLKRVVEEGEKWADEKPSE